MFLNVVVLYEREPDGKHFIVIDSDVLLDVYLNIQLTV
jgi:hypothetical protein